LEFKNQFLEITHKLLFLTLGLLTLILPLVLYFAQNGMTLSQLIAQISGGSNYASSWQNQSLFNQTLGMGSLTARTVLLVFLLLGLFLNRAKFNPKIQFVSIWLLTSLFAATLSSRPYSHYLLQAVAPLVILMSFLFWKIKPIEKLLIWSLVGLVTLTFIRFEFSFWPVKTYYRNFLNYSLGQIDQNQYYRNFDSRMPRNYEIAKRIRSLTNPADQIYIWGNEADIYVLSQRIQVGNLVVSFHVDDLNARDQTMDQILANQPDLIVIMESEDREFAKLKTLVQSEYFLIDKIGDPDLSLVESQGNLGLIYKKKPFGF
jgi:hypothetical protein